MTPHRDLVRSVMVACVLALVGLSGAMAQFPPPPGQSNSPFPPPPGQSANSPFPAPPGQSSPFPPPSGQQAAAPPASAPPVSAAPRGPSPFPMPGQSPAPGANPCEAFVPLRADAEKNAAAIRTASERQAQREEICTLFQRFAASEAKVVKFLETNQKQCGIPPDVIKQSKASHAKTIQIRTQVCRAGPAPAAPSLSDALGGPGTLDTSAPPRRGVGTFDTLTGSPLVR